MLDPFLFHGILSSKNGYTTNHRGAALLCPAHRGHFRRKVENNTTHHPTGDLPSSAAIYIESFPLLYKSNETPIFMSH